MGQKRSSQILSCGDGAKKVQSCSSVDSQSGALKVSCQPNIAVNGVGGTEDGIDDAIGEFWSGLGTVSLF